MLFNHAKLISAVLSASLLSVPMIANATLSITNNTNFDSTSIINNTCSTALGNKKGVTKRHSSNTVPDSAILLICGRTPDNCVADLRMTADCTGDSIATLVFSITSGITSATLTAAGQKAGYILSAQGFSVQMDGGPSFKA